MGSSGIEVRFSDESIVALRALFSGLAAERHELTLELLEPALSLAVEVTTFVGARGHLMVVIDSSPLQSGLGPAALAVGITYEVTVDEGVPHRAVRVTSSVGGRALRPGEHCWRQVHGRTSECADCPIRRLKGTQQATAVWVDPGAAFRATVQFARRKPEGRVAVTSVPIDGVTYSALVSARVEQLSGASNLSGREKELLQLLLMGRSTRDVSVVAGITERTAKFHQQNLLRKLGAESRYDLVRFLL